MFITSAPADPAAPFAPARDAGRPLVVGRDISPAEAARLSGEGLVARCVADIVVSTDAWLDLDARAQCLGLLLRREGVDPGGWVVGHEAAAWVHRGALGSVGDRARRSSGDSARAPAKFRAADGAVALEQVVVLGPRGRSARYAGVVVHRQAALDEDEVIALPEIRLTSPARTAADLLRLLPPAAAAAELDVLRAATSVTAEAIDAVLRRRRGARGVAAARRVLSEWAAADATAET